MKKYIRKIFQGAANSYPYQLISPLFTVQMQSLINPPGPLTSYDIDSVKNQDDYRSENEWPNT